MEHRIKLPKVSFFDLRILILDQKKMDSMTKLFISFGLVMKPTITVSENLAIGQK